MDTSSQHRYPELNSLRHLRNGGREFLGRRTYITEKRDGANIKLTAELIPDLVGEYVLHYEDFAFHGDAPGAYGAALTMNVNIGSRNKDDATPKFKHWVKQTPEFKKYVHMLAENPKWTIFVEYVPAGRGPTRIEPVHKKASLVLFDVFVGDQFLPYTYLYQQSVHYRIPIVKLVGELYPKSMGEIEEARDFGLKWARRHRREGVVIKAYAEDAGQQYVFFKEKIDMPAKPPLDRPKSPGIDIPVLPDTEVYGAIAKYDADIGIILQNQKDMPGIVKYVQEEARKHIMRAPGDIYRYYKHYLDEMNKQAEAIGPQ